ncbi:MAG: hypothetical protein ABJM11_19375, partial [Marinobacter sp.]
EKPRHKTRNRLTHRDRSEYKTDSSVMAVCKPVTIPGMTGHVRRNTHSRDVTNIGHWGTGNLEVNVRTFEDWEKARLLVDKAYQES